MRDRHAAHALARRLAPLLTGWSAEIPDEGDCAYLVRADGARIALDVGGYRRDGRVCFWGLPPKYKDGHQYWWTRDERFEITCDAKRSPDLLAREVKRRLLSRYDHAFAQALAEVKKFDEAMDDAESVAARIASIIGGTPGPDIFGRKRHGDGIQIRNEPQVISRLLVRGHAHEPTTVDFDVHGLDPQTAAEVLEIIKAAEDRKREETQARVGIAAMHEAEDLAEAQLDESREERRRRVG